MGETHRTLGGEAEEQADALRAPIDLSEVPMPEPLPPLEAIAIGEVRESVERLAQITAAQAEQLATLVEIGNAQHQDARSTARLTIGLTAVLVALTVAIAVLTYVLVAEALHWPPFPPEIRPPVELP